MPSGKQSCSPFVEVQDGKASLGSQLSERHSDKTIFLTKGRYYYLRQSSESRSNYEYSTDKILYVPGNARRVGITCKARTS